jgi:ABC-type branched-subunit amino acid transport system permease subunit
VLWVWPIWLWFSCLLIAQGIFGGRVWENHENHRNSWKHILVILVGLFVLVYPFAGATFMSTSSSFLRLGCGCRQFGLLNGYAGINSLGNIGFMAIGGYASGILEIARHITWISIPIGLMPASC